MVDSLPDSAQQGMLSSVMHRPAMITKARFFKGLFKGLLLACLIPAAAKAQFPPDPSVGRNIPDSVPIQAPDAYVHKPSELETKPDFSDVPVVGNPGSGILRKVVFSGATSRDNDEEGVPSAPGMYIDRVDLIVNERAFLESLRKDFLNKPFDLQVVRAITRETLRFYFHHERPLVYVAPTLIDYEHGVLRFAVVEATLDKKISTGARWFRPHYLLGMLRVSAGQHINREGLLNDVAILNQNPFMENQVVLKPGDQPGTTAVDLRTKDQFPVFGFLSADNTGTAQTGIWRWSTGINWGNAFSEGGQLSYQYSAPFQNPLSQPVQSVSYSAPLPWKHLLSIYGSYSTTDVNIDTGSGSLKDTGYTRQISPRYIIPLGKMYGKFIQNITLGADWISTDLDYVKGGNQVPANQTDIAQALLGYQFLLKDKYGQTSLSTDNYWSPGGIDPHNSTEAFRQVDNRTSANYYYSVLRLQRDTVLPKGCSLMTLFSGQLASSPLISNEQLSLGGYGTVRGYPQQILFGDQGCFLNVELHSPTYSLLSLAGLPTTPSDGEPEFLRRLRHDQLMFLAFWDYGMVNSIEPLPGDPANYSITSVGIGARYAIGNNLSLRCDLGFPLINPNVGVTIGPTLSMGASIGF